MKKANKELSYNPGRRDCIGQIIFTIFYTAFMVYELIEIIDFCSIFLVVFMTLAIIFLDVICVWNFYKDSVAKTAVNIELSGIQILFLNGDTPVFVPWDRNVYVNICIEKESVSEKLMIHRRVLCLSNWDISDSKVSYKQSVNYTHKMPSDCNELWIVLLVLSDAHECKKEREKVCAFKDAALSGERDIRE